MTPSETDGNNDVDVDHNVDHDAGLWTWPNAFTLARLLCLPLFVWLLFGPENRQVAGWLLGALGATDWVDGFLARRLNQGSEFGKIFDPTVDRLLFLVALIAIMIDGSIPIWFGVLVLGRELTVGSTMVVATVFFDMQRFDVSFLGKTATFLLLFAVPGFLIGNSMQAGADGFTIAAWIFGIPGLILSYYTAATYWPQVRAAVASGRASKSASSRSPTEM